MSDFGRPFPPDKTRGVVRKAYDKQAGFQCDNLGHLREPQVPQAGTLTALGLPGSELWDFDTVYKFNTTSQAYDIYTIAFGSWSPAEPTLAVGESVWLQPAVAGSWNRTFTVQ